MTCRRWYARRWVSVLTAPLVLAGGLAAISPAGAYASAKPASGGWTAAEPVNAGAYDNHLYGVAELSASDVWAVGSYAHSSNSSYKDLIEHWNGSAWSVVPSPDPGGGGDDFLYAVSAVSPSDVWAVGVYYSATAAHTLILNWNGTAWSQVASPTPGSYGDQLYGIQAVSATDIWAVGEYNNSMNADRTLILNWNGTSWSQVTTPNPGAQNDLYGVAATSSSSAWAVGSSAGKPYILEWNGTAWAQVATPAFPGTGSALLSVDATSAENAWAAGTVGTTSGQRTLMLKWNGTSWTRVSTPDPGGSDANDTLTAVAAASATSAWAVGDEHTSANQSLVLEWNGTAWTRVTAPNPKKAGKGGDLSAISAVSATSTWAVGQYGDNNAFALQCCAAAATTGRAHAGTDRS